MDAGAGNLESMMHYVRCDVQKALLQDMYIRYLIRG